MLIGLIGSYVMHGITFISNIFKNRQPIVNAINDIEKDAINISTDIEDIIQHPSLNTINKDVKDITNNLCDAVSDVKIIETIIIDAVKI